MATRRTRTPRIGRPLARGRTIPSQRSRLARGPTPPDHVLPQLERYLRSGGEAFPALGPQWQFALGQAWDAVKRHARRGVAKALGPIRRAIAQVVPGPGQGDWVARVTEAVSAAIRPGNLVLDLPEQIRRALGTLDRLILREHADLVIGIARAAGIEFYVWTTRRDGAVRALHQLLEGTIQAWHSPPLAGTPAFYGHPGQAARCRCVPYPLDPDLYAAILS